MQFDYEIPVEEYVAAQTLYLRKRYKGTLIKRALTWVLLGLLFFLVAVFRSEEFGPVLLVLTAGWFICCGIGILVPTRYCRQAYPATDLLGKNYHAELDDNGFSVSGDSCSWHVSWNEVHLKGEDKRLFMFNAKGSIFIFGKKYLTDEQQKELRRFVDMQ